MKPIKTILCYGDLHCGSISGLWPPDTPKGEGGGTKLNYNQKAMWKVWKDEVERRLPDYLLSRGLDGFDIGINGGDSIDGRQYRQQGVCTETTDLTAQTRAAIKAQEMLEGMIDNLYFLQGTPYHEENDYLSGELMAQALSNTFNVIPNERTGGLTHRHLFLTVADIRLMFKHELPAFQIYKATPLERELQRALRKEALEHAKERDILGFFHVHTHYLVQFPVGKQLKAAFTTPCHQVESMHITRKSLFNMLAHFGMVVIEIYERDYDPPFAIIPLTYPVTVRRPKEYVHE